VNKSSVTALAEQVAGDVLRPDDDGYDAARTVWNARFDRWPELIVRCAKTSDVQAAVEFARDMRMPLTVKGNGHSYAGNSTCDGGLLIDLKPMSTISIDAGARRAVVQAGATWGEFDAAAQAFGLAASGGTVSTVGISGLTLGGGEGWLTRKHGLACDNLIAADVVTASGDCIQASADTNPDLFWAIRGGGGNFGVVTRFEYALHEVGPELLAGQVIYDSRRLPELLRFYRDYFADAPDEVMGYFFCFRIPPIPAFPENLHGELVVDFVLCYCGDIADGETALAPFRSLGDPIVDTVAPMSYLALQQSFDAGMGSGNRWYTRGHKFDALSDDAIDAFASKLEPFPGEFTTAYIGADGGASGRVAGDATAFPHRSSRFEMHVFPGWVSHEDDDRIMGWARGLHAALAPFANGGVYLNLLADDEAARVPKAFGANYERLADIKRKWDPENLFRSNHNIVIE